MAKVDSQIPSACFSIANSTLALPMPVFSAPQNSHIKEAPGPLVGNPLCENGCPYFFVKKLNLMVWGPLQKRNSECLPGGLSDFFWPVVVRQDFFPAFFPAKINPQLRTLNQSQDPELQKQIAHNRGYFSTWGSNVRG